MTSEMSQLDEVGIRSIPRGSKLVLLGDWYRKPGHDWCQRQFKFDPFRSEFGNLNLTPL